jgi:hypothetical protein
MTLVNICDEELVGKTVTDGKLNMHLSKDYFGGNVTNGNMVLLLMKNSSIVNLVGSRAVSMAIENRLAAKEAVRVIDRVPFLMIYKFFY